MKFIDEFRNRDHVRALSNSIRNAMHREITLMEVCGGHTMAIQKFGIPSLLPESLHLVSGPGCPVCVTHRKYIDHLLELGRLPDTIVTTFGDLVRVPGSVSSPEAEKASGADFRIVYSILDAIQIAVANPTKEVVFAGIGFETTTPGTAAGLLRAQNLNLRNFSVLSAHKVMPPAMEALITAGVKIDGYIAPGHVSTITGTSMYQPFPEKFGVGCVISGFEPADLLQAVWMLVKQINDKKPAVEVAYKRAVNPDGNPKAVEIMQKVFEPCDDWWRGLGNIPHSGLALRKEFQEFDARLKFKVTLPPTREDKGCICGEILKGVANPGNCKLFAKVCTPDNPVGACMVSNEGACAAWYRYRRMT